MRIDDSLLYFGVVVITDTPSDGACGSDGDDCLIGIVHKFVVLSRGPSIIFLLSFIIIIILCLQNTHIHPASHNTGTDSRFVSFMSGHM